MKKLVILDFDGTLADTRALIIRTNQEAMRHMGYPIQDEETIAATIGLILEDGLLQMYPDLPKETLPEWVKTGAANRLLRHCDGAGRGTFS